MSKILSIILLAVFRGSSLKQKICHIPKGNVFNFHTITVNENAVDIHLNHSDLLGSCDQFCESLCPASDLCHYSRCGETGCLNEAEVDCTIDDPCISVSCNPMEGCIYKNNCTDAPSSSPTISPTISPTLLPTSSPTLSPTSSQTPQYNCLCSWPLVLDTCFAPIIPGFYQVLFQGSLNDVRVSPSRCSTCTNLGCISTPYTTDDYNDCKLAYNCP